MMLVNKNKKYAFLHVPKTGGTSFTAILTADGAVHHKAHPTLLELNNIFPITDYFYFAFVRNPWDRVYSLYTHMLQQVEHRPHILAMKNKNPTFKEWMFHDHTDWFHSNNPEYPQTRWLTINDEVKVDFVGRFETIEHDSNSLLKQLGLKATLPHLNISKRDTDYMKNYDDDMKDFMVKYHASDFEVFNYDISK